MRKIIGKGVLHIVPVSPHPNACQCPTITQLRDVDLNPEPPTATYKCRDISTEFEMNGTPVTFRFCVGPTVGYCQNLPQAFLCADQFIGVDTQKEYWTENGRQLIFEA